MLARIAELTKRVAELEAQIAQLLAEIKRLQDENEMYRRKMLSLENLLARAGGDEDGFPPLWNDGTLLMRYFIKRSACACCWLFFL